MKGSLDRNIDLVHNSSNKNLNSSHNEILGSVSSEADPSIVSSSKHQKPGAWSGIWSPPSSIFGNLNTSDSIRKKSASKNYYDGCRAAVRRFMMNGISLKKILGLMTATPSKSNIWLLGVCYQVFTEGEDVGSSDPTQSEGFAAFVEDFSSRILVTYRKGFAPIEDTKTCTDVGWGCMVRSSQMLVAQAFLCHNLGRSWRKSLHKALDLSYIEILHLFGDSEDSPCSIHNLLHAGKAYGLAAGLWVGPYAMCRTWESMVRNTRERTNNRVMSSMMAIYVVSGDEDGERGGAPALCIDDVAKHCSEFLAGQLEWSPVLLLVPLVLGLDKVNPRYLPLLSATFTFPQSLGILGGRPGASTYIVGVQDEKAFYLDPHEVQQTVDIKGNDVDVDTSSYHCNVLRQIPLDSIDSSLAIGFYCRDKSDFEDFCGRASDLVSQSNGAPLFTIANTRTLPKPSSTNHQDMDQSRDYEIVDNSENCAQEDDWQLL